MTLDEPNAAETVGEAEGYTFIADGQVQQMIKERGGVEIDFVESFFGGRLDVRFVKSGGCGC